jgi:DNA invertase Pin-like site-specific DNA recombinase
LRGLPLLDDNPLRLSRQSRTALQPCSSEKFFRISTELFSLFGTSLKPPAIPALRFTGKLILTIFAGLAQFERKMMLEPQRSGIAKAKAENRYLGRRPSARLKADEAVKLFKAGRSVTDIARALSIGRGSVYTALEAAGMKSVPGRT